eukprot:2117320-Alexandrium_andersonii.AAC.1
MAMLERSDGKGKVLRCQREAETWVRFPYRDYDPVHGSPPATDHQKAGEDPLFDHYRFNRYFARRGKAQLRNHDDVYRDEQ